MIERPYPTAPGAPRAIVVAVDLNRPERPLAPELEEFHALIEATGAIVLDTIVQARNAVDPATLIGSGKAREVAERAAELEATIVFVFNDLRPRQRINLEKIVPLTIVDRTMVILDIFAQFARSREGQLQVELAQLRYRQSNLIGAGAALSRLGGGIGSRGPGETKLEVDRRKIQSRVTWLRKSLEVVRRQRGTRRRSHASEPLIALVGYTNAGKSSLLNRLTNADAYVADRPFATLDPTLRRAYIGDENGKPAYAMLADTVGFITDLPEQLVNAFRATLEELEGADLLVHVIDASNPAWRRQRASVESILHELGLDEKPTLLVFNKADVIGPDGTDVSILPLPGACMVSARTGAGIEDLRERLRRFVPGVLTKETGR